MGAGVVRVKGTDARAGDVGRRQRPLLLPRSAARRDARGRRGGAQRRLRRRRCRSARTNCLNFGNPERPEIMWQFVEAVEGIGDACRALDIPITGGNVSLYNETDGKAIYPTPVIGVVGADRGRRPRAGARVPGARATRSSCSARIAASSAAASTCKAVHGLRARRRRRALDLDARARAAAAARVEPAADGLLRSAHDCSDGGLAVTLAECCFDTGGIGLRRRRAAATALAARRAVADATLFGESASRVVVAWRREHEAALLHAGVAARRAGRGASARPAATRLRIARRRRGRRSTCAVDERGAGVGDGTRARTSRRTGGVDRRAARTASRRRAHRCSTSSTTSAASSASSAIPKRPTSTYLGLYALQHRGQESAGHRRRRRRRAMRVSRAMGHVADVFNDARARHAAGPRRHRPHALLDRRREPARPTRSRS